MLQAIIPSTDIAKVIVAKHDRIIVVRDPAPVETEGGLSLAHLNLKPNTGRILSVGTRCKEAKAKQHVMFGKAAGTEVTLNGITLLIMHEADLMLDLDTMATFQDKVLLLPDAMPEIIKGIHIPDTVEDAPKSGVVVSVGPQCQETKPGDHVLLGSFAGLQIGEHLILREADLFASI